MPHDVVRIINGIEAALIAECSGNVDVVTVAQMEAACLHCAMILHGKALGINDPSIGMQKRILLALNAAIFQAFDSEFGTYVSERN